MALAWPKRARLGFLLRAGATASLVGSGLCNFVSAAFTIHRSHLKLYVVRDKFTPYARILSVDIGVCMHLYKSCLASSAQQVGMLVLGVTLSLRYDLSCDLL
ncbi:hypothetical protein BJY52DRAFT_1251600 [Lactarius psammicola]|nr:hypothetical protein BJY52DRAFT_1251600 [Lactarius psammicola]